MTRRKTNLIFVQEINNSGGNANPVSYDPGKPSHDDHFAPHSLHTPGFESGERVIRDVTDTRFYHIIKPLFVIMRIFGMFYIKQFNPKGKFSFGRIYCLVVTVCVVLNNCRSLTSFYRGEEFGPLFFFKLCITIWWLECAAKAIHCYVSSTRKVMLYDFCASWEKTCLSETVSLYETKMRKWTRSSVTQIVVFTLFHVVVTAYAMFVPPELVEFFNISLSPIPTDYPYVDVFRGFNLALHLLNTIVALIPLNLYKLICLALYYEFRLVNEKLTGSVDDDGEFFGNLEELRLRHQKLCKLVELADEIFSFFIAGAFTANIPLVCLMLYNLIYFHLHTSQIILEAFWVAMTTLHCSIVLGMGAMVNNEVICKSSKKIIWSGFDFFFSQSLMIISNHIFKFFCSITKIGR